MRALADGSGGVITAAQARPLGADQDAIRRLISRGEWARARRGVYRDLRLTLPDELDRAHHQRCAALLAALAAPAVISHTSAARLLNLPLPPGGGGARAHITRRPPAATNDPLLGDVHVTDYRDTDVLEIWGVPVLAGARFPEFRTVGEADGAGKYGEPGSLFAEKQREDWLRDTHEVEVVRWIPREMRGAAGRAGVVARFVRAFRRRS